MTETEFDWIAPGEQGFLVGETLYLRAMELGDAKYPAAWHDSPFPITRQRAETILKEEIPKEFEKRTHRLVACRRSDDVPVGGVSYNEANGRTAFVRVQANPALGDAAASVKAEILRIAVPWLSREWHSMVVWAELDAPEPAVIAAVEAVGMRPAVRLREAIWKDGARHDQWVYELLHPEWVERLGDPGPSIERATDPPTAVPASRRVSIANPAGPVPDNAILVGERVALRLSEPEDGKQAARLTRRETETFFSRGRWLFSPLLYTHWVEESGKKDPPTELFFSVILRETGDVIGEVELVDIHPLHRTAETGSMLYLPEHRGKGLGSEAKHLLLEYAFDHLGLHMLKSFVWGPNTRSQAALRKQGYRDAGRVQWRSHARAKYVENAIFDLLASEWRERVGSPTG